MSNIHTDLSLIQVAVAPSPATSGTSLGVSDAHAALLPTIYPWWGTDKPAGLVPTRANSEIVQVTAGSSSGGVTTYTIVREQGIPVTTARTIIVGDDFYEAHTAQKQIDIETSIGTKIAKTTNITALNETGIADGEIAVFNLTDKDIRTSNKTIVTSLGADDTTVPTSKAVKDITDGKQASGSYLTSVTPDAPLTGAGTSASHLAIPAATASVNGYATSTQITKLDGIATGATANAKATGAEADTGTDDAKFLTSKAAKDSHNIPSVAPSTSGNVLTSNGTDWTSSAPTGSLSFTLAPTADTVSGITMVITAHADVVLGDVCYINADGEAQIIDADAIATMNGVCMATATISANATGVFLMIGIAHCHTLNPTWTIGGKVYGTVTGTSTNTMSQTAPTGTDDVVQILGVAVAADTIYFKPGLSQTEVK